MVTFQFSQDRLLHTGWIQRTPNSIQFNLMKFLHRLPVCSVIGHAIVSDAVLKPLCGTTTCSSCCNAQPGCCAYPVNQFNNRGWLSGGTMVVQRNSEVSMYDVISLCSLGTALQINPISCRASSSGLVGFQCSPLRIDAGLVSVARGNQ